MRISSGTTPHDSTDLNNMGNYLNYSLWNRLKAHDKPIFLYGTGNGADKIIAALEKYGVSLDGIFASDGFVRDRHFHGFHVRSYSDVTAEYGDDIIVLLAFGTTLESVRAFIEELDKKHELIIPDVPLYGGDLFDLTYLNSHIKVLDAARELLSDEESVSLFDDAVNFRLSGRLEFLLRTEETADSLKFLFAGRHISSIIDGGAFKGDSASIFAEALSPDVIYAVEADPKTFVKLSAYAESEKRCKVIPINAAISDKDGEVEYSSSGSRGAGEEGRNRRAKTHSVKCISLDSYFTDVAIDLIKLDIEGAEAEAISGGTELIKRCEPDMAVSLYHRTDDIFTLIFTVHALLPHHKLFLRRVRCIPMWDITLYAIK